MGLGGRLRTFRGGVYLSFPVLDPATGAYCLPSGATMPTLRRFTKLRYTTIAEAAQRIALVLEATPKGQEPDLTEHADLEWRKMHEAFDGT